MSALNRRNAFCMTGRPPCPDRYSVHPHTVYHELSYIRNIEYYRDKLVSRFDPKMENASSLDRIGVGPFGTERRVRRIEERDSDAPRALSMWIAHDPDGEGLIDFAGREHERAAGHRIVDAAPLRRAPCNRVAHPHGPAG